MIDIINNLKELNCFSFVGSTVVDGDLNFCEGIEYVSFTDKKHYSHKSYLLTRYNEREKMKFPKDEDGQVLNMLYKQGIDFNKNI